MKKLLLLAVAVFVLVITPQRAAFAQESNPENTVKAFYTWYIALSSPEPGYSFSDPLLDDKIYTFVSEQTVNRLRAKQAIDALDEEDYFTKIVYEAEGWADRITVFPAVMLQDIAIVSVTFGIKKPVQTSVVVFLREFDKTWKIVKVIDTLDGYR